MVSALSTESEVACRGFRAWLASLLMLLAGTFSLACDAQTHFTYRFDDRSPNRIFRDGFSPRGHNLDLTNHVMTWNRDSGFVATTSDYGAALGFAQDRFDRVSSSAMFGYIYIVAADDSFYDLSFSLQHFLLVQRIAGISDDHRALEREIENALTGFFHEREVVASQGISNDRILAAIEVRGIRQPNGNIRVQEGARLENNRYSGDRNTMVNPGPYPMSWPSDTSSSSSSSSTCSTTSESLGGSNCSHDLLVVAGPRGLFHPSQTPDCQSPKQRQINAELAVCPGLPLINLSKRMRAVMTTITAFP